MEYYKKQYVNKDLEEINKLSKTEAVTNNFLRFPIKIQKK